MRHSWETDGFGDEMIFCAMLDPRLMLVERLAAFDADAEDAALVLLDEWHAELVT